MELSNSFALSYFGFIFGAQTATSVLANQPDEWAITIHEAANDPNGTNLDSTWYTDPLIRRSKAIISSWDAISGNFTNGVEIPAQIGMEDYVPQGDTWNIDHYIIWGLDSGTPYPIFTGSFGATIVLTSLQVLLIDTLTIS